MRALAKGFPCCRLKKTGRAVADQGNLKAATRLLILPGSTFTLAFEVRRRFGRPRSGVALISPSSRLDNRVPLPYGNFWSPNRSPAMASPVFSKSRGGSFA